MHVAEEVGGCQFMSWDISMNSQLQWAWS